MGLFGSKTKRELIELAQTMAHSANETNNEIAELLAAYEQSSKAFAHLPDQLIDLAKQIMDKLEESEMKELTELTQLTCKLHQDYLDKYQSVLDLAMQQSDRVAQATNTYHKLAKS